MKKTLFVLTIILFFGSCKSYQDLTIDSERKSYKRHLIITKKGERYKTKIVFNDDETISFYHKKERITMNLSDIKSIQSKQYSKERTINSFTIVASLMLTVFL